MDEPFVKSQPISSKTLIGNHVKNEQGEDLGEIEEIMIEPEAGFVSNLVLKTGDLTGSKQVAVPWDMVKFAADGTLHMNIEKEFIERIPAYEHN